MAIRKQDITRWYLGGKQVKAGTPGAEKKVSKSKKWYGDIPRPGKRPLRVPLSTNRTDSQRLYGKLLERAERQRVGTHDPVAEHSATPLTQHIADFIESVKAGRRKRRRPPTPQRLRLLEFRLQALADGGLFVFAGDIEPQRVEAYILSRVGQDALVIPDQQLFTLAEVSALIASSKAAIGKRCNKLGLARVGFGSATRYPRETVVRLSQKSSSIGRTTAAEYIRSLRRFTRWLLRRGRIYADPLLDLEFSCPDHDGRRQRRPLTADEIERLLAATRDSTHLFRELTGSDRHMLYLLAMSTGFRCSELASLEMTSFRLEQDPPLVLLARDESKNGEGATQPLPLDVAQSLREYLSCRTPHAAIWPGSWYAYGAEMLRRDLAAANIPELVAGPECMLHVDFHALRHTFGASLKRAGVTLSQAMRLMRHSDPKLTMSIYGREDLSELGAAVQKIARPKQASDPPS